MGCIWLYLCSARDQRHRGSQKTEKISSAPHSDQRVASDFRRQPKSERLTWMRRPVSAHFKSGLAGQARLSSSAALAGTAAQFSQRTDIAETRMDRTDRFDRINKLRRPQLTTMVDIIRELEVSRATVKRDLAYMRDPACTHRSSGSQADAGISHADAPAGQSRYSLPGLRLDSSEIHSLLIMENLIRKFQPGFWAGISAPGVSG